MCSSSFCTYYLFIGSKLGKQFLPREYYTVNVLLVFDTCTNMDKFKSATFSSLAFKTLRFSHKKVAGAAQARGSVQSINTRLREHWSNCQQISHPGNVASHVSWCRVYIWETIQSCPRLKNQVRHTSWPAGECISTPSTVLSSEEIIYAETIVNISKVSVPVAEEVWPSEQKLPDMSCARVVQFE